MVYYVLTMRNQWRIDEWRIKNSKNNSENSRGDAARSPPDRHHAFLSSTCTVHASMKNKIKITVVYYSCDAFTRTQIDFTEYPTDTFPLTPHPPMLRLRNRPYPLHTQVAARGPGAARVGDLAGSSGGRGGDLRVQFSFRDATLRSTWTEKKITKNNGPDRPA